MDKGELILEGSALSEGIAIGTPYFFPHEWDEDVPDFTIHAHDVEDEVSRYRNALFCSREDLQKLRSDIVREGSHEVAREVASILDTHIQMLEDPLMTTQMEQKIRNMMRNTESVFKSVIKEYETRFLKKNNIFFQQRLVDVIDVSKRILRHLCPDKKISITDIPQNSIIFAKQLDPSQTAALSPSVVLGFVTQFGVSSSHAALIAKAKGIPHVSNIDFKTVRNAKFSQAIINGSSGKVIINPGLETCNQYLFMRKIEKNRRDFLEKENSHPSITSDGVDISLYGNISALEEMSFIHEHGAHGVGLLRSEFFFLSSTRQDLEEENQFLLYQSILNKSNGLTITFRVLDLGGDKILPPLQEEISKIPMMRGIQFLLKNKPLLKTQLRAILRAAVQGEVQILLPMVSDVQEIKDVKAMIEILRRELHAEGHPVASEIPLGCMIEIPLAVTICESLMTECDFLSIGTNDLIEHTLGLNRAQAQTEDGYAAHPTIVRMIKFIAEKAAIAGCPVTVCGDMASNALFTQLLLGLGLRHLSCTPRIIPYIKEIVRKSTLVECQELAEKVLSMTVASEISAFLLAHHKSL